MKPSPYATPVWTVVRWRCGVGTRHSPCPARPWIRGPALRSSRRVPTGQWLMQDREDLGPQGFLQPTGPAVHADLSGVTACRHAGPCDVVVIGHFDDRRAASVRPTPRLPAVTSSSSTGSAGSTARSSRSVLGMSSAVRRRRPTTRSPPSSWRSARTSTIRLRDHGTRAGGCPEFEPVLADAQRVQPQLVNRACGSSAWSSAASRRPTGR